MTTEYRPTPLRNGTHDDPTSQRANYRAWRVEPRDFHAPADLIRWAVLAPSSHNTQPWLFEVKQDAILVRPDLSRASRV